MRTSTFAPGFAGTRPAYSYRPSLNLDARAVNLRDTRILEKLEGVETTRLRDCIAEGIAATGTINLRDCTIRGVARTERNLIVAGSLIRSVVAHEVDISGSRIADTVTASGWIRISSSVAKFIYASSIKTNTIRGSSIGQLTAGALRLVLDDAQIDTLTLKLPIQSTASNRRRIPRGAFWPGAIRDGWVNLAANARLNLNNFIISSSPYQTTVVTPDKTTYVNGRKTSGRGPATYADYQAQHRGAFNIYGPGWTDGKVNPQPILILKNGSTVRKVVFPSGNGRVILRGDVEFKGTVEGGDVERE